MFKLIGEIIAILAVLSVIVAALALLASKASLKGHVRAAGFFSGVLDFFYLPLKYFFFKFSDTRVLDKWMFSLKNIANKDEFAKTSKRMIIAPHCMRSLDCPAVSTRTGIQCTACGKCAFSRLKEDAVRYGYKLYIVTGSSFVKHIIKEEKYDGALLIACDYELNKVMMALKGKDIVTYGVPMLNDGCYNTEVDYDSVLAVLDMFTKRSKH